MTAGQTTETAGAAGSAQTVREQDISGQLQSILSDPERMRQLMQMASALAGSGILQGTVRQENDSPSAAALPGEITAAPDSAEERQTNNPGSERNPEKVPRIAGNGSRSSGGRHAAFLNALRPYMSPQRQKRIDQILKMIRLAELADAAGKLTV